MGKLIRFLGYLVGLLLLVIVGLSIALPLLFDPNDYKDKITEVVQQETGRELLIGGDIGLTVFPWLGLKLSDVQLSNAKGFGDAPFARMDAASVRVKLLPLLRKQVEMDTVSLDGLQLNLSTQKDGRTNWDDLVAQDSKPDTAGTEDKSITLDSLDIGGVQLKDARVVWDDRSTGSRYVMDKLSLTTGPVQLDAPIDMELSFQLQSKEPELQGMVEISGDLWVSNSMQQFKMSEFQVVVNAQGKELPGGRVEAKLNAELQLDMEKQKFDLAQLGLELMGLQLDGDFHASAILGDAPKYSGTLDLQQFVPREVMELLGQEIPVTADATVLGKADAHLAFNGSANSVQIKPFRLRFDDTDVNGSLGIRNFASPGIKIDLSIDILDLDRYLPPADTSSAAKPAGGADTGATSLPVETLRGLNLSGKLKIGSLKAFGIRSSDVNMEVNAKNGKLRLHPASAKMYQGSYSGDISIDASGPSPRLSMNESVNHVQVGPLLRDMTGKEEKLTGVADVKLTLSGTGNDITAMQKTLNGNATFSFKDGAVKGVNIAKVLREGKARFKGKSVPKDSTADQTDFSAMTGTIKITNGVVRNDDFDARSPLLRLTGKGKVDMVKETIDYLLTVKLVGSLKGQGGDDLVGLKGVAIPVRVGGTFAKPTYRPDLEAALGDAVKEKVQEKVDEQKEILEKKLEEKLQDKLGDQLKDGLKGFF